jgi:calcineurin-like phosphoesterase family protein
VVIVFFHYNLKGDHAAWCSDEDHTALAELLTLYKDRVKLLIHGHHHTTYWAEWRGIKVVCVGGKELALFTVDTDAQTIDVDFYTSTNKQPQKLTTQDIAELGWSVRYDTIMKQVEKQKERLKELWNKSIVDQYKIIALKKEKLKNRLLFS